MVRSEGVAALADDEINTSDHSIDDEIELSELYGKALKQMMK